MAVQNKQSNEANSDEFEGYSRGIIQSLFKEQAARGWQQYELANALHFDKGDLSRFATGKKQPNLKLLFALHDLTGKSLDELVGIGAAREKKVELSEQLATVFVNLPDEVFDFICRVLVREVARLENPPKVRTRLTVNEVLEIVHNARDNEISKMTTNE